MKEDSAAVQRAIHFLTFINVHTLIYHLGTVWDQTTPTLLGDLFYNLAETVDAYSKNAFPAAGKHKPHHFIFLYTFSLYFITEL